MVRSISRASDSRGLKWTNSASEYREVDMEALVGGGVTLEKIALVMQQMLQDEEDFVVARNTLPNDELTKTSNPNNSRQFWSGSTLITRSNIITIEIVNGEFVPTVRVA